MTKVRNKRSHHLGVTLCTDRPKSSSDFAWRRIEPFLRYWSMIDYSMERLLVSAYLQGVEDCAQVIHKYPEQVQPIIDYQI